jgi:hypothetical protein
MPLSVRNNQRSTHNAEREMSSRAWTNNDRKGWKRTSLLSAFQLEMRSSETSYSYRVRVGILLDFLLIPRVFMHAGIISDTVTKLTQYYIPGLEP